MVDPLPHDVNIAKALKASGIRSTGEPELHILGGRLVTAEIDAKRALQRVASVTERVATGEISVDLFDASVLTEAADSMATYRRAKLELFTTADALGARQ